MFSAAKLLQFFEMYKIFSKKLAKTCTRAIFVVIILRDGIGKAEGNVVEFDHFRMHAGLPNFVLSVSEWLEKTNAVGLIFHHSII